MKKTPDRARLLAWLENPANFAETLFTADDEKVRLDPWQHSYLSSGARFTVILKSRRVGGSWAMTVKTLVRALTIPRYKAVFVSMNREEAQGKIEYADELYESLPSAWRLRKVARSRDEIAFVDSSGRRSVLRSLAAKAPRGRGGDVGVSELPHCANSRAIYEGALHVTARDEKSQLTIESTPLGGSGVFHDICRGKYREFTRYEIPWWLCSALCSDVEEAAALAPLLSTRDRVAKYGSPALKSIYSSMPEEAFRQESELAFVQIENAAFPMEMIMACAEPEFGESSTALAYRHVVGVPSGADWEWLIRNRKGILAAGYDPARKNDRSALVILDHAGGRFETRLTVAMKNVAFADQSGVLTAAIGRGVSLLRIDSTGIGMDMSERLERDYPGVAAGVMFTVRSKQMMVANLYGTLTDQRIVLPADRELVGQIGAIREVRSESGAALYQSPSGSAGHGDMAWALMLALQAARGLAADTGAGYQSLSSRARWNCVT